MGLVGGMGGTRVRSLWPAAPPPALARGAAGPGGATQVAGIEALAEHHRARILLERLRGEVTPSFRTLVHDGRLNSPAASAPRTASGPEEN